MVNKDRLINQFKELVMIDSETGDERQIADYLLLKFKELGLDVVEDNSMKYSGHGAGNIIATINKNSNQDDFHSIYFTSHMDTVKPGKKIQPKIKGEYIVSDGTTILGSDDKAGIAAILEALLLLKENEVTHGNIQILITAGEESGLKGSRSLQKELIDADYGFALDSNGPVGNIIIAAPTQAKINIGVNGKSAHAGVNPEDGISAIQVASHAISHMKLGRIDHETTANIGSFKGGVATNVVCDRVDILAEARSLNEEKLHKQLKQMEEALNKAAQHFETTIDFDYEIMYPPFRYDAGSTIVKVAEKAVQAIGRKPKLVESGGGSDANVMNGYGIPTVNLGVGYEKIHTTSERISIGEMLKSVELVVELIKHSKK